METPDLSDYKVTSEVHVFSEGVASDEQKHEGIPFCSTITVLIHEYICLFQ